MGAPEIDSIDKYITYPLIKKYIYLFSNIHPITITLYCIGFKTWSIYLLQTIYPNHYLLGFTLTLERLLDCLDGEVARHYKKTTQLGHYLDKYSDLVYRIGMCYYCLVILVNTPIWNIYSYILFILIMLCPSLYLYDYKSGYLSNSLVCNPKGIAILLEDNATIICLLLPILLSLL